MNVKLPCLLVALAAAAGQSSADSYPNTDLLVEAADLARPATASGFHVLDARPRDQYLAGHVPGAVWVDHDAWAKAFDDGQDADAWAKRMAALGVDLDTTVVVYDDNRCKDAARIWFVLHYWGVKDVRLLGDGGWRAWADAGKVSKDEPTVPSRDVKLAPQERRLATKGQVLQLLKGEGSQIIDARSSQEFCGEAVTAKRNGAIPGALHLEWSDVIDAKTQRFKTREELAKLFQDAGKLNRPAVTHCQSGGRASVMAFTLELMGAKDVRNYYKSWAEWGNAEDTPVVKPTPKK